MGIASMPPPRVSHLGNGSTVEHSLGANETNTWPLPPGADQLRFDLQRRTGEIDALSNAPSSGASIAGIVAGIRWGAVVLGMVFAIPRSTDGDLSVVTTLSVVLFLTTWRMFRPVGLGLGRLPPHVVPNRISIRSYLDRSNAVHVSDAAVVGMALGWSGGLTSPFAYVLVVIAAIAGFAERWRFGAIVLTTGVAALVISGTITDGDIDIIGQQSFATLAVGAAGMLLASIAADRVADADRSRQRLRSTVEVLADTNDMLQLLTQVARTLPAALDLRDALDQIRAQVDKAFSPRAVCLVTPDESGDRWSPVIADGLALAPSTVTDELAPALREALTSPTSILAPATPDAVSGPGLYAALRARDHVVGIIGLERPVGGPFNDRDQRTLDGMVELFALSLDNARWFGRLRLLGAEEERTRIARDLHDRLGQWLTYINLELERLIDSGAEPQPELTSLHRDVGRAIDELRESLRQLRSMVRVDHSFAHAARESLGAFERRSEVKAVLAVTSPDDRLPIPVENELLRILQEALHNIDKHARATQVWVTWDVASDVARLVVTDNGCGFDLGTGVRDSAYGLTGMRERADAVAGLLDVQSTPGSGTTIQVTISRRTLPASAQGQLAPDTGVKR